MKTQLLRLKQATPDLLYITGFGPAVTLAYNQAKQLGLTFPIAGIVICGQSNVLDAAREALEDTFSSAVKYDENSDRYKALRKEYQAAAPGRILDQNTLSAYDNVWVIAEAVKSGARSGTAIRDFVHTKKTFEVASGRIEFTPQGDSDRPTVMRQIKDGVCVPL